MGGVLGVLLVLGLVVWGVYKAGQSPARPVTRSYTTMRCPTCGAEARVYGTTWECTWCGDFGSCSRR